MTARHALVSGASIAGLTTAYWLARTGWRVSVIERAPEFRDGGQNVDVRGPAREVVERMGLTEAVKARNTTEEGTRFVDAEGRAVGEFPAAPGEDGPTAELEILRGDLARCVLEVLDDDVELAFGETIASVEQAPGSPARVVLASGRELDVDLVVVAEGPRSSTRELVFGDVAERNELDLTIVYGTIPRIESDDRWWNWFTAVDQRQISLRPDDKGTTRAMLAHYSDVDDLTGLEGDAYEARLREIFGDAGWQAERVLDGIAASDDVYTEFLTQISMPHWSQGRVVLVGDAGWCVTPLAGGGSSLALLGGYTLAAALTHDDDVEAGLSRYEQTLRPVVDDTQKLPPGVPRLAYPRSGFGVRVMHAALRVASSKPVRSLAARTIGDTVDSEHELLEIRRGSAGQERAAHDAQ